MSAFHPIPTLKKIMELIGSQVGASVGIPVVGFRFGAWGPLFHHPPSPMNIPAQMVRAAVGGETLDFSLPRSRAFAEDGTDLSYVKDCGRAIALLQLAGKLTTQRTTSDRAGRQQPRVCGRDTQGNSRGAVCAAVGVRSSRARPTLGPGYWTTPRGHRLCSRVRRRESSR